MRPSKTRSTLKKHFFNFVELISTCLLFFLLVSFCCFFYLFAFPFFKKLIMIRVQRLIYYFLILLFFAFVSITLLPSLKSTTPPSASVYEQVPVSKTAVKADPNSEKYLSWFPHRYFFLNTRYLVERELTYILS